MECFFSASRAGFLRRRSVAGLHLRSALVVFGATLLAHSVAAHSSLLPEYNGFIRIQDGRFVDADCQEFPITGMNTWMLMEAAAGLAVIPCAATSDAVKYTFDTAAASGFTVVRVFGHGVNGTLPLQYSPGAYNETAFAALDYIIDTAAYTGVKLILTMGDNWQYADSKRNYNLWAGFDQDSDSFWTSNITRQMYKDHIEVVVNRVNTLNGVRYRDDPAIFAWNLMNEPRCNCFPAALPYPAIFSQLPSGCNPSCADSITDWIGEMSFFLKSLDSNHLVTVGEEGFFGYYDSRIQFNPEDSVSPWASLTGNNFSAQHSFDSIDFSTVHYWPDEWTPKATSDEAFFSGWMAQHAAATAALGKPFLLEELGKEVVANSSREELESSVAQRRLPFMQMVYSGFNQSLQTGGNWRGTLFWKWGFCPNNTNDDFLQVAAGDADFQEIIVPAAVSAVNQALFASPLSNCQTVMGANSTESDSSPAGGGESIAATARTQNLPSTPTLPLPGSKNTSVTSFQTAGR